MGVLTPEHAFISYSHLDQMIAQRVRDDLEAAGIKTWIDEQIEPGTPAWDRAIRDAITGSFAVILIGSPHAKDGLYVPDELQIAARQGRDIIPLWLAGNDWTDCAPLGWGRAQYINCCGDQYTTGITQLAKKLQQIIDTRSPAMQLLTKEEADKYREFIFRYSIIYEPRAANVTLLRQDYLYIELVNGDFVAMRYGAFDTIGELLDALYMEHLRNQYAPYMYGNQWVLGTPNNRYSTLMQLLLPWDWLSIPKNRSIAQLQSDWSNFPSATWFASSHLRYLRVLDKLPPIAFGVVTNSGRAIEKMRDVKRGYALKRSLLSMVNNHSHKDHWFEYAITLSERPEEVNPGDYQYHLVVASGEGDNPRDYVQPGEVTRIVCVID